MPQVVDNRSSAEISESHPFLEWFGRMAGLGVSIYKRDIVLDRSLSGRFVVGLEEDGEMTLGIQDEDVRHLLSIRWTKGAMLRNFKGGDWLVLTSDDEAESIRFFIPMASSIADRFSGYDGTTLRIRRTRMKDGVPEAAKKPQAEVPLTLHGF